LPDLEVVIDAPKSACSQVDKAVSAK